MAKVLDVLIPTVVIVFILAAATGVGCINGAETARKGLQQEAIEHGFAEYNPTTGAWQWKASVTDPTRPTE